MVSPVYYDKLEVGSLITTLNFTKQNMFVKKR